MRGSSVITKLQAVVHNSPSSALISTGASFLGHWVRGNFNHEGPFHHKSWCMSSEGNSPRDAQSAGFSSLATWFQQSAGVRSIIWATRLPTYTLKRRGFPWIQANTIVESVQACIELDGMSRTFLQWESCCARVNAPFNSNLGIVSRLIGATRVFEVTSEV